MCSLRCRLTLLTSLIFKQINAYNHTQEENLMLDSLCGGFVHENMTTLAVSCELEKNKAVLRRRRNKFLPAAADQDGHLLLSRTLASLQAAGGEEDR